MLSRFAGIFKDGIRGAFQQTAGVSVLQAKRTCHIPSAFWLQYGAQPPAFQTF